MNTDQIHTFIAVYRAQSFIAVAKERNVAPSSITRAIAALETQLATRLFQRSTRSVTPTEAGDAYYMQMSPLMEAFDEAHDSLAQLGAGPSGRLRVSASVSYGQIVIAPLLKAFRECYPDIDLELILSDRRVDIISEQIDIAIRHGRLPDSALTARKLSDVTYKLVSSPEYLSQNAKIKTPDDLTEHDLLTFTYDDFRYEWTFQKKDEVKTLPISPVITISNAGAIRQCVERGMGIALLADWTVSADLASGKLVEVLPKWDVSGLAQNTMIWLVYPSSRFVPAKTRAFVDFIVERMS